MTFSIPAFTKQQLAFAFVYTLLAAALVVAAFGFGRGTTVVVHESTPAYCNGKAFEGCVLTAVVSQGAPVGTTVSCVAVADTTGREQCDVRMMNFDGPTCYDLVVTRTKQGMPIVGSPAQRAKC